MDQVTAALVDRARQHALGDLLRRTALRLPDKLAVVSGDTRLTFAEFEAAANRCAHALAARGLRKGDRLALLSHNCWQYGVLAFATAKLGVLLVPVNFMLGADEVAYILRHAEAAAFVTEDALEATAAEALELSGLKDVVRGRIGPGGGWEDVGTWLSEGDDRAPDVVVADDDPLRLMYTSGTESRPKGVLLSSRSLIAQYVSCVKHH
ncbi:AMP-binding protein [Amycolatopsis sp. cmx-8-4]|uniref:AMP-binding protein n=1 Tax=Amycolatopsis sp. cmx-8-4 TaxID=2790947 RepID=UPI00397DDB3B